VKRRFVIACGAAAAVVVLLFWFINLESRGMPPGPGALRRSVDTAAAEHPDFNARGDMDGILRMWAKDGARRDAVEALIDRMRRTRSSPLVFVEWSPQNVGGYKAVLIFQSGKGLLARAPAHGELSVAPLTITGSALRQLGEFVECGGFTSDIRSAGVCDAEGHFVTVWRRDGRRTTFCAYALLLEEIRSSSPGTSGSVRETNRLRDFVNLVLSAAEAGEGNSEEAPDAGAGE